MGAVCEYELQFGTGSMKQKNISKKQAAAVGTVCCGKGCWMVPKTWNVGYVSALTWPVIGRSRLCHQRHVVNCDKNSFLKEYIGQSWEEGGRLPLYGRQDLFPII